MCCAVRCGGFESQLEPRFVFSFVLGVCLLSPGVGFCVCELRTGSSVHVFSGFQSCLESEQGPDAVKWSQMESNGVKWSQMESNGVKWSQMGSNGVKWSQMESNGPNGITDAVQK